MWLPFGRPAPDADLPAKKLRDAVLLGGHKEELRNRIRSRLQERKQVDPEELEQARTKVRRLDGEIEHGVKRLLRAPDDIADLLGSELSRMRKERERLARRLEELESLECPEVDDVEALVDQAVDRLWSIVEELDKAEPARLRELIRRMVHRIDLWFDHVPKGKRVECPLSRGTIQLRPDPVLFRLDNRGDWTRTSDLSVPNAAL